MRVLELFSGIGGVAAALAQPPRLGTVIQAVDIDPDCGQVYRLNHGLRPDAMTLESASVWKARIRHREAGLWWFSPPCQPYCRRGKQADQDPRRAALQKITKVLAETTSPPQAVAMENVPEFAGSSDRDDLVAALRARGMLVREQQLCPTDWGIPNRRVRYYLTAWQAAGPTASRPPHAQSPQTRGLQPLAGFLDPQPAPELWVDDNFSERYGQAIDRVTAEDARSVTACFIGGYGKSLLKAGSYLQLPGGRLRRFSPCEIQRLLGFPDAYRWPENLATRRRYKMLGNSLSVPVVRAVLETLARR